jgi:hypothetical protein
LQSLCRAAVTRSDDGLSRKNIPTRWRPPQGTAYTNKPTTFLSSSQLSAQFNNGNDPGNWTVFVTNPDSQTSNTVSFTVTATAPAPALSGVSPSSYPANNNNQTMLVNGSNFQSGATLTFHDPQGTAYTNKPTTFLSSSQLSAQFNNGNDPGNWTVFVTNPDHRDLKPANILVRRAQRCAAGSPATIRNKVYGSMLFVGGL